MNDEHFIFVDMEFSDTDKSTPYNLLSVYNIHQNNKRVCQMGMGSCVVIIGKTIGIRDRNDECYRIDG